LLSITETDLTALNTLGLSSKGTAVFRLRSTSQLQELQAQLPRYTGTFVLGGGSNVVLAPSIDKLVIKVETRGMTVLEESERHIIVEAQAGENWHTFVHHCVRSGMPGLENLALIPGTVGASPVQNIGAYGVEFDQRFHSLLAWDLHHGGVSEFGYADCDFSYRHSYFKAEGAGRWLILAVRFCLPKPWRPVLDYPDLLRHASLLSDGQAVQPQAIFNAVCDIRTRKLPDPAVLGNAGSFFKNPIVSAAQYEALREKHPGLVAYPQADGQHYKLAAGWLIDQAGWKGRRMGPVGVHDRQALVLVHHGGGNADDVLRLASAIRDDVLTRYGVALEQEPILVD